MGTDPSFLARILGSNFRRYLLALAAVAAAFLVNSALHPLVGDRAGYVLLFPAVAFSAWYCGIGPSIVAALLALVGSTYGFIPPIQPFRVFTVAEFVRALVFLCSSAAIVAMGEARRRQNERLQNEQGALEKRVQERTTDLDTANGNLRELSARLLQLQDDERRRIARELHDSVGQTLAALAMNLSAVRLDVERLTTIAHALTDSENLVRDMSTEVRTISHLLHPLCSMKPVWRPPCAGMSRGLPCAAKSRLNSISPKTSAACPVNPKLPSFAWCRNASPTSTGILKVPSPGFAFATATTRCWSRSQTRAKASRPKKSNNWPPRARPESESEECANASDSSAARWKSTPTAQAPWS